MPDAMFCTGCGSEKNLLGNCPHGCPDTVAEPEPVPWPLKLHFLDSFAERLTFLAGMLTEATPEDRGKLLGVVVELRSLAGEMESSLRSDDPTQTDLRLMP